MTETKKSKKGIIIFDFDGVIVDSVMLTYEYTKKALPFMNWNLYRKIGDARWFIKITRLVGKLLRRNKKEHIQTRKSQYSQEKLESRLISGMDKALFDLKQDYILALNTNASLENSLPILQKYGIADCFETIKTRDDEYSKTLKTLQILKEHKTAPERALFITDSFRDVEDAKMANVKSIAVLSGMHAKTHFESSSSSDYLFAISTDVADLKNKINLYFGEA